MSFEEQIEEIRRRKEEAEQQDQEEEMVAQTRQEFPIDINALTISNIGMYKQTQARQELINSLAEMPLSSSKRSEMVPVVNTVALSRVEDIPGDDPLKLSKYLKSAMLEAVRSEKATSLQAKQLPKNLRDSVNMNYPM
jgi:hypothetical protein